MNRTRDHDPIEPGQDMDHPMPRFNGVPAQQRADYVAQAGAQQKNPTGDGRAL